VKHTEDERVDPGFLFIVTCTGGTIGSKGTHEVLLPDLGCSKLHARITFQTSNLTYYLRDLGSRNGTWVNGKRLSASKQESEDVHIGHGTCVQIGKTKLICHVHPGKETCLECEPGLQQGSRSGPPPPPAVRKEEARVRELKEIKNSYAIGDGVAENSSRLQPGYTDRAEERRVVHGVDPINAKTETASVNQPIGSKNKGFRMLEKMGWEGGGLGRAGQEGIQEPVQVQQRAKQAGLGSSVPSFAEAPSGLEKRRNEIWKKTAKRFNKVPVLDAFNQPDSSEEED